MMPAADLETVPRPGQVQSFHPSSELEEIHTRCSRLVGALQSSIKATEIPPDAHRALAETRLIGVMIPKSYGGLGMDCAARLQSVVETTRLSPEVGAFLQIAQLGTSALLDFGTEPQRQRWLPSLASGQRICTLAITEENSGSHLAGCSTRYRQTEQGFVLNGEKWMIGNAPIADMHAVLARDEQSDAMSVFLVDGDADGIDASRTQPTRGLRNFPFGAVELTNVLVPLENMIGQPGEGQRIAHQVIARHGRLSLTGLALGIHQRIFDTVCDFARRRCLYGKPLVDLPDVRTRIFEIYSNLEQARSVACRAAEAERSRAHSGVLLALAKQVNSSLACKSALVAMEVFGGRANLQDVEIGQLLLDAAMTLAPSGTSDVLKRRILEDILGERPIRWAEDQPNNGGAENARAEAIS